MLLCALAALTASVMGGPESEESLRTAVSSHLDPGSARRLIRMVDDVRREGRDAGPLENKIREGIAKGASGPAIIQAATMRAQRLARIEKSPDVRSRNRRELQRSLYDLERAETRRRGVPDRARFSPRDYGAPHDEGGIESRLPGFENQADRREGLRKQRGRTNAIEQRGGISGREIGNEQRRKQKTENAGGRARGKLRNRRPDTPDRSAEKGLRSRLNRRGRQADKRLRGRERKLKNREEREQRLRGKLKRKYPPGGAR